MLVALVAACGGGGGASGDCRDGETRACYSGRAGTEGVGTCAAGVETCSAGAWSGVCVGDVIPFVEHCDGRDEDCNGVVDDTDEAGQACTGGDGCDGETACVGDLLTCLAPAKNECGVCGGRAIDTLGMTCEAGGCPGTFVCNVAGDGAECNAAPENACGVCGGPVVAGLGDACTGDNACDGELVCNTAGTGTACDCSPVPGQCKDGGVLRAIVSPGPGELVITEVMPSPSAVSDTDGEWVEVQVIADIDLNGVELDRAGDTAAPRLIESAICLRVTAGSRLLFARSADPLLNGGLPAVTATFGFSLIGGSATTPGDVRVLANGTLIDAVTWASSPTGAARQLDPDLVDAVANDSEASFCNATTPYGTGSPQDLGTPGAANTQCGVVVPPGSCNDGGTVRAIMKPAAGQLVITEFLADPAGTDTAKEWFEITNTGATAFDLNELTLGRAATTSSTTITSATCLELAPDGFALFARSADPMQNGMLPTVDATFGFGLVNATGDVEVRDGATVLDSVTWASSTSGVSSQRDPDSPTFCPSTTPYGDGTNTGSPRAANAQCP